MTQKMDLLLLYITVLFLVKSQNHGACVFWWVELNINYGICWQTFMQIIALRRTKMTKKTFFAIILVYFEVFLFLCAAQTRSLCCLCCFFSVKFKLLRFTCNEFGPRMKSL